MYQVRKYPNDKSYHHTFYELVSFLNQINDDNRCLHMHWSRLEWLFARDNVKEEELSLNLLFYEKEDIVGAILYEDEPGVYFLVYQNNTQLKRYMIDYLMHETNYRDVIIPNDKEMIELLTSSQFKKEDWIDPISVFTIDHYEIPKIEGYSFLSLDEDYRLDQIHHALWMGFNHGDDISYDDKNLEDRRHMTSSPHFQKKYTYVAIHDNQYVSYAGIWYLKGSKTALIEPVATTPKHRRKGLMKACIYHAIEAVRKDGNPMIFVGSNQEAYQKIGFEPHSEGLRFKKT
jgi:GNAT superfamily N-acetyltransferase